MVFRTKEGPTPNNGDQRILSHWSLYKRLPGCIVILGRWQELQAYQQSTLLINSRGKETYYTTGRWVTISAKPTE